MVVFVGPRIPNPRHGARKDEHVTLLLIPVRLGLKSVEPQDRVVWGEYSHHQISAIFVYASRPFSDHVVYVSACPLNC